MLNRLLRIISNFNDRLNPRERRLAAAVVVLALALAAMAFGRGAMTRLRMLDTNIEQRQQNLVNYTYAISRKQSVEAHYVKVAAQHSSKWSEPEIHDRLRQEIYRLAQKNPSPLDENGVPLRAGDGPKLVDIPSLPQGTLTSAEEGYRQYALSLQLPNTSMDAVFTFLSRLQDSPQSLRIDSLDVFRDALTPATSAKVDITRIIVNGAGPAASDSARPSAEGQWKCDGGEVKQQAPSEGSVRQIMKVQALQEGGQFYRIAPLDAGASYEMFLDAKINGKAKLGVADESGKDFFPGAEDIPKDRKPYRYTVKFTVPGAAGSQVVLRAPCLVFQGVDTRIMIYNVMLKKVSE
jgi:hypothetical protein